MTTYVKVSELPASTTLADADVFIYNDDTTTSKITFSNLKSSVRTYILGEDNTFTGVTTLDGNVTFGTSATISGLDKADVGLANVDNTADTAKPVSTATQTALDLKADLAGPALTGTPTAPTATAGTNTTQIATTAFVTAAITADNSTDLILGSSSIDALGDVDTTTVAPTSGDFLKFDGTNFVPDSPATFELDGTTLRNITGGHTFALRNASLADTITLNSETGAVDVTGVTTFGGDVNFNSGALFFKQSNSRLGLGTTSPGAQFHSVSDSEMARFERDSGSSRLSVKPNTADDGITLQGQSNSPNCIRFEGYGNNVGFRFEENNAGSYTTLAHIKSTGIDFNKDVTFTPSASVTPASNGDLMIEATNDTTLTFKFKGSDGTVRSGTITLS